MSKIPSYEKFYISKIVSALESQNYPSCDKVIQMLLSDSLHEDKSFNELIEKALELSYKNDISESKESARESWNEHFIKIYKGRENNLKNIIIKWYPKHEHPGFLDRIKNFFNKKF